MDYDINCHVHVHAAAWHSEGNFRAFTPGLGALCRKNDVLAVAGVFQNSEGGIGPYAVVGWQPWVINGIRVGAYGGVIKGYKRGTMPVAAGLVSMPMTFGELHLTLIPKVHNITPWTVGISYSF